MREGWTRVSLGEVAGLRKDSAHRRNLTEEVLYLGLEHLREGGGIVHTGTGKDFTGGVLRFDCGDALYGKLRPYFRKATQASESGYCTPEIWVIQTRSQLMDQGFLFRVISSQAFTDYVNAASDGTRMPRARWDVARTFPVALPPIDEQRRIAEILGSIDHLIELNSRQGIRLSQFLDAWWLRFARDCLESIQLSNLVAVSKGLSYKGKLLSDTGLPLLNLGNFGIDGEFKASGVKFYPDSETKPAQVLAKGDLIVANTDLTQNRELLGRPLLVPFLRATSTHHTYQLRGASSDAQRSWIYFTLRQQTLRRKLAQAATGTTVAALPRDVLSAAPIPAPSQEQTEAWWAVCEPLLALSLALSSSVAELADQRDQLLPLLMSGRATVGEVAA